VIARAACLLFLSIVSMQAAAVCSWNAGSGNWGTAANWTCTTGAVNHVPTNTDDVTLQGNLTVTVNVAASARSVLIDPPSGNNQTTTLAVGAQTLTIATAGLTLNGGNNNRDVALTISTGTVNVTGTVAITGITTNTAITFTGAGTMNVTGDFQNGTNFTAGTGTVNYNGAAAQSIGAYTYNVLKVNNAAGATLSGAATAATLTIGDVTANSVFSDGGFQLTSTGTLNLTSGTMQLGSATTATTLPAFATRNIAAGTTVEYAAGVAQTVSATPAYANLTFSGAGAKTTAAGTLSIGGNWTLSGGAATLSTNNTVVSLTGNLAGTGNIAQGTGTISLAGDWTNTGTFSAPAGSTVNYNGAAAQSVSTGPGYRNLTFSGAGTKTTAAGTLSISGNWSVGSTTALNTNNTVVNLTGNLTGAGSITQGSGLITVAGDWTNTGTFSASSAGVTLTGAGKQITGPAAGITFTTLTVNGTYTNNNTNTGITVSALNGTGTLTQGTNAVLTLSGTVGITTLTASANPNTVIYNGSAAQTVKATTYHHLTINNASGVSITANAAVNGTLTLTQGNVSTGVNTLITAANCNTPSVVRPAGPPTPGYVIGRMQKTIPAGTTNCTFEVGTASGYTQIDASYVGVTTGGNVVGTVATPAHPSIAGSGINTTRKVNRYWTLATPATGSLPSGGNYGATFTFLNPTDLDGGAATAAFVVKRYASGSWSSTTNGAHTATSTQALGLIGYGDFALGEETSANFARERQFIYTRELY
jgi:hypothetical protein